MSAWTLHEHPGDIAVCRLPVGAEAPDWATTHPSPIVSLTYTADETSLVCAASGVPGDVPHEGPFTSYSIAGPLDFTLTGVLAGLLQPLAEAGISVFTLSTHGTDWILIPTGRSGPAKEALRRRGHVIVDHPQDQPSS